MKQVILAVAAAVLIGGSAYAQAPNKAAVEKQIVEMERAINAAFAKNDAAGVKRHVADDGTAVDGMGVMPVAEFLKALPNAKIESWNIDGSRFLWLNNDAVVHMYRWTGKGSMMGQPFPSPSNASTVWVNRGGRWLAVFHQDTPVIPAPPKK